MGTWLHPTQTIRGVPTQWVTQHLNRLSRSNQDQINESFCFVRINENTMKIPRKHPRKIDKQNPLDKFINAKLKYTKNQRKINLHTNFFRPKLSPQKPSIERRRKLSLRRVDVLLEKNWGGSSWVGL